MNNNDFDELVKKAQTMINNNQVPPEIAEMMRNMNANNNIKNHNNNSSSSSNSNNANENSSSFDNGNMMNKQGSQNYHNYNNDKNSGIDLNAIISNTNFNQESDDISNLLTNFNQESDDISNLLKALKPYMSNAKKEKIDEYIKLVQMGKAAKLFNELNNNNNNK